MGQNRTLAFSVAAALASLAAVGSAQALTVEVWGGYNTPNGTVNPSPGVPATVNGAQDPAPTGAPVATFTYNGPINWQDNELNNGDDHTKNLFGEFFTPADISAFSSPGGEYTNDAAGLANFLASSLSVEESNLDTFYTYIQVSGTTSGGMATISHDDGASVYSGTPGSGSIVYLAPLQTVDDTASFHMPAGAFYIDYIEANGAPSDLVFGVAVPEPSTWAMMLTGFGLLGFAGFRHSRKTRFATI
jgi:PEP-CTERM motif